MKRCSFLGAMRCVSDTSWFFVCVYGLDPFYVVSGSIGTYSYTLLPARILNQIA